MGCKVKIDGYDPGHGVVSLDWEKEFPSDVSFDEIEDAVWDDLAISLFDVDTLKVECDGEDITRSFMEWFLDKNKELYIDYDDLELRLYDLPYWIDEAVAERYLMPDLEEAREEAEIIRKGGYDALYGAPSRY